MTFLNAILFWALPLIFLPVLIHFLNRLRHRPQPWAAMRFLILASRQSSSHTRLRQFLILLFRVLCVLMLIAFMARPLAGGWLGWALSPAPDAILILLDRSASMETRIDGVSKRELALKTIARAAAPFDGVSHLVLIDSATRRPQEVAKSADLARLSVAQATDTAADIPAMLAAAVRWLSDNRAGAAEIWIASDAQRSNWLPDDARWKGLAAQLSAMRVRARLLALPGAPPSDAAVSLKEIVRRQRAGKAELQFAIDIQRNQASSAPVPLAMNLDGARSQMETPMDGQSLRWRQRTELGDHPAGGWGAFELPPDSNPRNNAAFFVYGPDTPLQAVIIANDDAASRCLRLACMDRASKPAETLSVAEIAGATLAEHALIVWQDALPEGPAAERLRQFAEEGGVVVFFPPGRPGSQAFNAVSWGAVQEAPPDNPFHVLRWDEDQGPLARSDERLSLPVARLAFAKRQKLAGPKTLLAAFEDGEPFLARQILGKGEVYFCASLPNDDWSALGDGTVLVPMMQRMLQTGARRLQQVAFCACGELGAEDLAKPWTCVDAPGAKDIRFDAGVYRSGSRMMAVNRPAAEDDPDVIDSDQARALFGGVPFRSFADRAGDDSPLQGEIWRLFLLGMLLFLVAEAVLILPPKPAVGRKGAL